ncbi:MAG: FABP family protein [Nitrospina sp.]|jgi:hypothetical protein|nr:FABP family protein [Nitrospina sp.]MBT3511346.1 FABP family protein [Nitrospina sp.]MBT4047430.1 FABP family protein [Nitrospina sp.]MBT4556003.1 FABP family protein [Nitrospina sp.]MBT5348808.1 FABP family protein [Nitrospina sp.]
MNDELIKNLGPLAPLAGTWEGDKGDDTAPDDDPRKVENNKYRERLVLDPFGPVNNHAQTLYGLRYSTTAWRLEAENPFHEELGYWLWDPSEKQVMRCFIVPRGVTVMAGGTVEPEAREFHLAAEAGSETYGICSNKFLVQEFKTVRYELKVTVHDANSFSYEEDTQLQIKGQSELFHHIDKNTLKRLPS